MEALVAHVANALPFRAVAVETLREDWPEKREVAETRIRAFVRTAGSEGGRAIVLPLRVYGFGPYASVLSGLDYVADGRGLLPDARVTEWTEEQASACFSREGWRNPFESGGPAAKLP